MPDRYGEEPTPHDPRCRDGWLGEDDAGHPIPCLQCRPHLAARPADDTPNLSERARAALAREDRP